MNLTITEHEEKFRKLMDAMANGIAIYSSTDGQHFVFTGMNSAGERMCDVTFQAIAGKEVREVFPGVVAMGLYDVLRRVWASGASENQPAVYYNDQRISRCYENYVCKISVTEIAAVYSEITEQKKSMEELSRREEQLQVLFEVSQAGILLVDPTGTITLGNSRMAEMFGCTLEELIGSCYPDHVHAEHLGQGDVCMRKLIAGEIDHVATERRYMRKDGSDFWGYITGRRHVDSAGNFISLVGHITDISEIKRSEAAIRESEERYRTLVDNVPLGISRIDRDYRIIMTNNTQAEMFGHPPEWFKGRFCYEVFEKRSEVCVHCPGTECMNTGALSHAYTEGVRDDGSRFDVHIQTAPLRGDNDELYGFIEAVEDITERKRAEIERQKLEQQLLHIQKLESLGMLASGIAHDFNNILTGIIGNISIAALLLGQEHKAAERLKECQNAAGRAAELTQQLLTFSRGGEPVKRAVDVTRLITESLSFSLRGSNVKGEFDCVDDLWQIDADAGQINQVLNNLLINARQAMAAGGTVRVRADNCEIHKGDSLLLAPGRYVRIAVEDEGYGIPATEFDRIFDPYFTTKERGTGLGLTSVHSIARRHGGQVEVASQVGYGTTFTICLPAVADAVQEKPDQYQGHGLLRGNGRVLVMDDEEMIRDLVVAMLEEAGYLVECSGDGAQAVASFTRAREAGAPFDAAILDLTVPGGMGGKEAAALIREQDHAVVMIVSSGYSNDPVVADFRKYGFNGVVSKPYNIESFTGELARLLSGCSYD